MKPLVFLLLVRLQLLSATGSEIRAYQLSSHAMKQALQRVVVGPAVLETDEEDPFAADAYDQTFAPFPEDLEGDLWLGPKIEKAPFESRFFEKAGPLHDCSKAIAHLVQCEALDGHAIYDLKNQKLIVNSSCQFHYGIREAIERELSLQILSEFTVYRRSNETAEHVSKYCAEVPEDWEIVSSLSFLAQLGRSVAAGTADGALKVECEFQLEANEGYVETREEFELKLPEGSVSYQSGHIRLVGLSWVEDLGAFDEKSALVLARKSDLVTGDGIAFDEWIECEEQGVILLEERLALASAPEGAQMNYVEGKAYQVMPFPYPFHSFLHANKPPTIQSIVKLTDEPALQNLKGGVANLEVLLKQNGLAFREGDFVVLHPQTGLLYVKLDRLNFDLLHGLVHATLGLGPPRTMSLRLSEIEGLNMETGRLLRSVSVPLLPGQQAEANLGPEFRIQAEMQIDHLDSLAELRCTLEVGMPLNPILKTGITLQNDQPCLIYTSQVDGKQRSWIATAQISALDQEVAGFRAKRSLRSASEQE